MVLETQKLLPVWVVTGLGINFFQKRWKPFKDRTFELLIGVKRKATDPNSLY